MPCGLPSAPHDEVAPLPIYLIATRHNTPRPPKNIFCKWFHEALRYHRYALEERYLHGLTPLLFTVCMNALELADSPLQRGADPYARVMGDRPAIAGENAFSLLAQLQEKDQPAIQPAID